MDIQFYGANCLSVNTKHGRVLIDDNLTDLGAKSPAKTDDIALFTSIHASPVESAKIVIDQPGEYEVSGISVYGIAARAHMDEEKKKSATMYKIITDDLRLLVTGHIYPELTDSQLEAIGMIDVMFVPVGGNGYTLDPLGALKLIRKVEPKVIVPVHYDDDQIMYQVPQQTLDQALSALTMEPKETVTKLKLKSGELGDVTQLIVVQRA